MNLLPLLLKILSVIGGVLALVPLLRYFERKVTAAAQDPASPKRLGMKWCLAVIKANPKKLSDTMKDVRRARRSTAFLLRKKMEADKLAHNILIPFAPILAMLPPLAAFIVIPFGPVAVSAGGDAIRFQLADLNIGVMFILAAAGLSVFIPDLALLVADRKNAILKGMRSTVRMLGFHAGIWLIVAMIILKTGDLRLRVIVSSQTGHLNLAGGAVWWPRWNIFSLTGLMGAIVFFISGTAATFYVPFESLEHSLPGIGRIPDSDTTSRAGAFFLAEHLCVLMIAALGVTLFLGGWHLPWMNRIVHTGTLAFAMIGTAVFVIKTLVVALLMTVVRGGVKPTGFERLMTLGWKTIVPLAMVLVAVTAFTMVIYPGNSVI